MSRRSGASFRVVKFPKNIGPNIFFPSSSLCDIFLLSSYACVVFYQNSVKIKETTVVHDFSLLLRWASAIVGDEMIEAVSESSTALSLFIAMLSLYFCRPRGRSAT